MSCSATNIFNLTDDTLINDFPVNAVVTRSQTKKRLNSVNDATSSNVVNIHDESIDISLPESTSIQTGNVSDGDSVEQKASSLADAAQSSGIGDESAVNKAAETRGSERHKYVAAGQRVNVQNRAVCSTGESITDVPFITTGDNEESGQRSSDLSDRHITSDSHSDNNECVPQSVDGNSISASSTEMPNDDETDAEFRRLNCIAQETMPDGSVDQDDAVNSKCISL